MGHLVGYRPCHGPLGKLSAPSWATWSVIVPVIGHLVSYRPCHGPFGQLKARVSSTRSNFFPNYVDHLPGKTTASSTTVTLCRPLAIQGNCLQYTAVTLCRPLAMQDNCLQYGGHTMKTTCHAKQLPPVRRPYYADHFLLARGQGD
jgi:hypothetical protein